MSSDDDLDDLLGPEPEAEPLPKPFRPQLRKRASPEIDAQTIDRLQEPVTATFISKALGMDRKRVVGLLSKLEPVGLHRRNVPLYNFRQALGVLIQPKVTPKMIEDRLKRMSADDIPASLQKDVWDARLKAQKWMVQAGELWPTEDVLEVLGDTFQTLKTTTQLWIDQIGDNHDLPEKARQELTLLVDGLQKDLHQRLVEMPKERATPAQVAAAKEEI
ncbi:MAG: hypothetical protein AAGG09_11210 [Pseudomonadota bacterium]